jgi:hypothetical protein
VLRQVRQDKALPVATVVVPVLTTAVQVVVLVL